MPKNLAKLASLQPPLRNLAQAFAEIFERETGRELTFVEGYRSPERQDELYAQGRTTGGPIVTWVKGLFSWHNYGLAFDAAPSDVLSDPDWDPDNPLWEKLGQIGERVGLTWGGRWKKPDKPHFEFHPGLSLEEVRDYFLKTGEVLVSKVLRPEVLFAILLGIGGYLWYSRKYFS